MPDSTPGCVAAGWGLVVCVLAMLAAAAVEWYRLKLFHEGKVLPASGGNQSHSILSHRDGSGIVDMNVFWQVPQYLLVGLSEVSCPECVRRLAILLFKLEFEIACCVTDVSWGSLYAAVTGR